MRTFVENKGKGKRKEIRLEFIKNDKQKNDLSVIRIKIESVVGKFVCIDHHENAILIMNGRNADTIKYRFSCCCERFKEVVMAGVHRAFDGND